MKIANTAVEGLACPDERRLVPLNLRELATVLEILSKAKDSRDRTSLLPRLAALWNAAEVLVEEPEDAVE